MVKFFADLIDQLDFALDHVILEHINYKRLSLMLVDNVMELALHRYAEERSAENRYRHDNPKHDPGSVADALGQRFEAKVKLARLCGLIDEDTAGSIETLHIFRNQLYHRGVMHEPILSALALFYFRVACDVLAAFKPRGYSWSNKLQIPHRAVKYIGKKPNDRPSEVFPAAWARLREVSDSIPLRLSDDLHRDLEKAINHIDEMIGYLVQDPEKETRDKVVMDSQAWAMAFTEEGKKFAREHGATTDTVGNYVEWVAANYPWYIRKDPVDSWKQRLASLKSEPDEHKALRKYSEFMTQTQRFREAVDASAAALDQHVEEQIERTRGN